MWRPGAWKNLGQSYFSRTCFSDGTAHLLRLRWWDDLAVRTWRRISKTIPANLLGDRAPALAELELNFSGSGPRFFTIFSTCPKLIYTSGIKRPQDIRAEEFYTPKQDCKLLCRYEAMEIHSMCDLSSCVWTFLCWDNISFTLSGADFRELRASFLVIAIEGYFLICQFSYPRCTTDSRRENGHRNAKDI